MAKAQEEGVFFGRRVETDSGLMQWKPPLCFASK
jgi:hypothetical protein